MRFTLFVLIAVALISGAVFYLKDQYSSTSSIVSSANAVILNGETFNIEIADTPALRDRGLSGHAPLENNEGMLFIFKESGDYVFWMKDMLFPIDMIWIYSDSKVVHIEKNISPETYPKVFKSELNSLYVLEVLAGASDVVSLEIGDVVQFVKK